MHKTLQKLHKFKEVDQILPDHWIWILNFVMQSPKTLTNNHALVALSTLFLREASPKDIYHVDYIFLILFLDYYDQLGIALIYLMIMNFFINKI